MDCPNCNETMKPGRIAARLKSETMFSFIEPPERAFELRFEGDDGETATPALQGKSYHCVSCDTVVLAGGFSALKCFECDEPIPEEAQACPACGWTWGASE